MRILAVCAGNICRSPTAEAAIRKEAAEAGLEVEVDSAGTGAWNLGEPPQPQAVAAGQAVGLEVTGRARRIHLADFDRYDMILAMDRANLRDLEAMAPSAEARAKIRLFRTYDETTLEDEIPDPYGGSQEQYEATVEMVQAAARGLITTMTRT